MLCWTCRLEALGSEREASATCKIDQDFLGKLDRAGEQLAVCRARERSFPAGLSLAPKQRPVSEKAALSCCPKTWRLLCPAGGEPPSPPLQMRLQMPPASASFSLHMTEVWAVVNSDSWW